MDLVDFGGIAFVRFHCFLGESIFKLDSVRLGQMFRFFWLRLVFIILFYLPVGVSSFESVLFLTFYVFCKFCLVLFYTGYLFEGSGSLAQDVVP